MIRAAAFSSVQNGFDVVHSGDEGSFCAVVGMEAGLGWVEQVVSFEVDGELMVDGLF